MTAEANTVPVKSPLGAFRSNAWTDLALTLPVFLVYHLGVITLQVRNAADFFTQKLIGVAQNSMLEYWGITLAIGMGLVALLWLFGRAEAFDASRFLLVAGEGVVYAIVMRAAAVYAVGSLPLAGAAIGGGWTGVVMSLGAGLYEEIAFRVVLFGGGVLLLRLFFGGIMKLALAIGWAVACAAAFSAWHYLGPLGDTPQLHSFVFRMVCGLVFTGIYALRGFAPVVWTHALYDMWVLVPA